MSTDHLKNTRRKTAGGIKYRLQAGFPKIQCKDDGTTATEQYLMKSSLAEAFYIESMPPPIVLLGVGFLPPRRRMPGTGMLITESIDFEPHSPDLAWDPMGIDSGGDYDRYCLATINYSTKQESDDNDRDPKDPKTFLEKSMTAGGQFLNVPARKLKIQEVDNEGNALPAQPQSPSAGNPQPPAAPGSVEDNFDVELPTIKTIPTIEWSLKWPIALDPNFGNMVAQLGKTNNKESSLLEGAAKDTALFTGFSGTRKWVWSGAGARAQPWSLDFKFSQRVVRDGGRIFGWNHVYSPNKGRWVKVTTAAGRPLHESFDLDNSFA